MVAAYVTTSPVVSPLLSSLFSSLPSEGVVLSLPSSASPPLTGVGKGVKVSFPPFCSSPEGAGVLVVPEGGAVSFVCPPSAGVPTGSFPSLLLAPLSLDEPSGCSVAGAIFVCWEPSPPAPSSANTPTGGRASVIESANVQVRSFLPLFFSVIKTPLFLSAGFGTGKQYVFR